MSFAVEGITPYVHNVGPAIVIVVCLIWLGYRASSLLILPVDQVIRLLNLDVPPAPKIALDAVTSETISLRWQVPDKQSVSKHLIQLNGTVIGDSDKKDTNVIVTGLNPDQLYCIRVIAANSQRLHAASEVIRVRTKPRTEESTSENSHEHIPVIQTHPPPNEPAPSPNIPPQSKHRLSSARDQPVRRLSNAAATANAKAERSRSNSASSTQPPSSTPQTLESLAQELDRVHRETSDITAQLDSEEEKNKIEVHKLESELEDLRARRKEDDDCKAGIKAETKALEEQKRSVDGQKSRLERTYRTFQDDLAKLEGEASARLRDLAEKEQALADLCDQTALAERKVKEAKTTGSEGLVEVQKQITSLEESNRVLAQRITSMKAQLESKETDEETARRCSIDEHEDEEDLKVEREWYESERSLKSRHDLVRSQFDEANREYREALAMLVHARELHTTAHPIPPMPAPGKHRTKKQRSRRTRQKALNMMGQTNSSSPSLDASINSSRPTSLALPQGVEAGMFYSPEYHDSTMPPYDYQNSSPWASTHSLGLLHDISPPINTDYDRERLTGGALLSPSVSEHLLPSNLFGPDEDSIRTDPYIDRLLQNSPPSTTPRISNTYPPIDRTADSPVSEMSTRSSFSSPNQSHPALPLHSGPIFNESQSSPIIIMTPPMSYITNSIAEQEDVEVTSPAELNGIPLSAENTDEETPLESNESTSPLKHWKIPTLSFKRKTLPPEKRLPVLGTLKGEKARSMPRTSAGATPIGFNRPRSGSGSSSGWLQNVTRARAPSETGRQFDTNFDPLESRRLLEGAGVVHHHSQLANPVVFDSSPRASFESRSTMSRRSTDTDMARHYSPQTGYFRATSNVYSDLSSPYGWISQPGSSISVPAPLSLPTSPSGSMIPGFTPGLINDVHEHWSPPNTSRSSLDPKAPEFRTSLQQFLAPEEIEVPETSPKRGSGRFAIARRSTLRQGDSFLNNFTGLFRREAKIGEDEDNDLTRPKSQDTQLSGEPSAGGTGSVEDLAIEGTPEKKKKEKKKRDKAKGKSLFRWDSKTDSIEDPELTASKSLESMKPEETEAEDTPKKKKKKGKKGVKFEKVEGDTITSPAQNSQEFGTYNDEGKEVILEDSPVKILSLFK